MGRKTKTVLIAAVAAVLVGLIVIAMILLRPTDDAVFDSHVEKVDSAAAMASEADIGGTGVMEEAREAVSAPESATAQDTEEAQALYESIVSSPLTVTISADNGVTDTISTDTLQSWVSLDGTQVNVDASQVASYVQGIADKYNSWGKQISFTTHSGNTISLGAVDYGWKLNQDVTAADIQAAVLAGNGGTVPVTWSSKETVMGTNGVGNTYIEADLDAQHVYVYKGGSMIMETDVVSGRALKNWGTPNGVFEIVGMQRDATLKGENYATPVKYWMPFYLGWGFHDANWRSVFGGDQYVANGSHGCINLPPAFAQQLFETIYVGMPVVVYGGMSQDQAQTYIASKSSQDGNADASDAASSGDSSNENGDNADGEGDGSTGNGDNGGNTGADGANGDSSDVANTSSSDASAIADAKAIAAAVGLSTDEQQAQIIAQAVANYEAVGMTREQAKAQVQADLQQQASAQQAAAQNEGDAAGAEGSGTSQAATGSNGTTQAATGAGSDGSQGTAGTPEQSQTPAQDAAN